MSSPARRRQAFTLVEILVVIVIIGLLLAILFPAIQAARTAAQSAASANNLRQIGIAGLNFESRTGHYPASWNQTKVTSSATDATGWSVHAILLPYLEQKLISSNIDYTRSYNDAGNVTLADGTNEKITSMRVPTFLSPGNPRDEVRFEDGEKSHYPVDYAVNVGQYFVWDPATGEGGSGMAYPNSQVKAANVTDGLSFTVFFAEVKSWQVYFRNAGKTEAQLVTIGDPANAHVVDTTDGSTSLFTTLNGGSSSAQFKNAEPGSGSGHTEWVDGRCHQIGFTTTFTPNTPLVHKHTDGLPYDCDWTNWQEGKGLLSASPVDTPTYAVITARGHFEGGVNVVMADGSVKWVDNSIELSIWRAYGSRAGQELIPPAKQL